MDIRNMRQLLAVRTYGSFAKAAQVLGMSQPSLSAAISRMEDQLKVKLFDRSAGGSELTPVGEMIAERAAKVLEETQQMIRDAELVTGGEAGVVRVGVSNSLKRAFLPRFVRTLAESYPGLSIQFDVQDCDSLVPLVRSRQIDIGICAYDGDITAEGLLATEVLTTRGVAAARPDHPLVGERRVSLERFAEFTGSGSIHAEFSNLALLGVRGERDALLRYQSNDYDVLLELALDGLTTLIAPAFIVQPYVDAGRLSRIDLDWDYRLSFAAVTTRAASYSPIISRVIGHAVSIGGALHPPG